MGLRNKKLMKAIRKNILAVNNPYLLCWNLEYKNRYKLLCLLKGIYQTIAIIFCENNTYI